MTIEGHRPDTFLLIRAGAMPLLIRVVDKSTNGGEANAPWQNGYFQYLFE